MKFYARKVNGVLIEADEESGDMIKSLRKDSIIECTVKKKRNLKNHNRFFTFIGRAFDMQEHYTNKTMFRSWLTMKAGYLTTSVAPNGYVNFYPKSLGFSGELDEEEFRIFFKKCITVYLEEFQKGMTNDEFMQILDYD